MSSTRGGQATERVAIVAQLAQDSHEQARRILEEGAQYDLAEAGFERHSIFLTEQTVVFVFEGKAVGEAIRELLNDPTMSGLFSAWGPLLQGTPRLAHEEFYWEASPPEH
jgi:hypothetical protein